MSNKSRSLLVVMTTVLALSTVLSVAAIAATDHLVLNEVVMKARLGYGSEFVEVFNPTVSTIDLSDVYLTDATNTGVGYWQIVQGSGAGGGGSNGDFHARFPSGTLLGAGESLVVSLAGSEAFETAYGVLPDFELFEEDSEPDEVPEMLEAFPGSIGYGLGSTATNTPHVTEGWLSDTGESLMLYRWNGTSDLVEDLDYVLWGTANTYRVNKTGLSVDGPDVGTGGGTYLADTPVASQQTLGVHNFDKALARTNLDETGETATGGNGATGHNETSEPLVSTWNSAADQTPTSTGTVPAPTPIVLAVDLAPATVFDGQTATVSITAAANDGIASVTLNWSTNDGATWIPVVALGSGSVWSAQIPAQATDSIVRWWVELTGTGGGTSAFPPSAPFYYASYTVLELPEAGDGPAHLLLTEICVSGTENEFIEIYNPTSETVDLENYYLTDAVYNTQGYWLVPAGNLSQATVGGGGFVDFHGRFPNGSQILPGEALTISMAGSTVFAEAWGVAPDFEVLEDGASADGVPDLVEIFPGSLIGDPATGGFATLTNGAEIVVLYYWDGVTPLVTDVDMFFWGSSTSARVDKTGVSVNGSTYMADTPLASQDEFMPVHDFGGSYERLDPSEGTETLLGGNGPLGHDETSENLSGTWGTATLGNPGLYGTQDLVFTGAFTTPARPTPDTATTVTGELVNLVAITSVTLHFAIDGGAFETVAASINGDGTWSADIPQQVEGTDVDWYITAEGAGGASASWPADAPTTVLSFTVETLPEPVTDPPHLLLSEVCVQGSSSEFIEIYNPTDEAVELDNYYLTDAVYNNQAYWRLPEGNPDQTTVGGGDFGDFNARFPAGMVIEPGQTLTITIPGSEAFEGIWGVAPDIELREDGGIDGIPDMRDVFPGSRNGGVDGSSATLSNAAEIVVLYFWDQVSNLVVDIDMFMWGSSTSTVVARSGYAINGEAYAIDTPAGSQDPFALLHEFGDTFQRLDSTEGAEPVSGGNGTLDHDETGENLNTTWLMSGGTPGEYSEYVASYAFDPAQPEAGSPSSFSLTLVESDALPPVDSVILHYNVNNGSYTQVSLVETQTGTWGGNLPALQEGQILGWYVSISYGENVVYFPADYLTNPNTVEVMAPISLSVEPKTFLPDSETFPIVITYPDQHEAVLRILDMEGRVIRNLYDSRFDLLGSPINRVEFDWDGRNDEFELVKAGTYIVHLQTMNELTGERENKTAPAVVATRLSR